MEKADSPQLIAGRYEIRRPIGAGGSGAVFQAWDTQLHRFVAVKRWKPPETLSGNQVDMERLWREAMTLAAIQHPNILTIHDYGLDEQGPYVITEFVDGESLDKTIQRGLPTLEEIADLVQQTLEALIAAHQANLIHRDLKPQNIMRTKLPSGAWQYKILDFGLARFVTEPTVQSMEGNTSIYGSIFCIAPEQLYHDPLDARTDLYAIGCVYYYMLAGRNAFDGENIPAVIAAHLQHRVEDLCAVRPDLPRPLCAWVMKMISAEPGERYTSAAEALVEFRKVMPAGSRTSTLRVTAPTRTLKITPVPPGSHSPGGGTVPKTGVLTIPPTRRVSAIPAEPAAGRPRTSRRAWWFAASAMILVGSALAAWLALRQPAAVVPAEDTATTPTADDTRPTRTTSLLFPNSIPPERHAKLLAIYNTLRDMDGVKWGNVGSVIEAVALLEFQERYPPPDYAVLGNMSYHDETGRTIGELDLVLWNVPSNCAAAVYEVKVSDNYRSALRRARSQLRRLKEFVEQRKISRFIYERDPTWAFETPQFDGARMGFVGGRGAVSEGCDEEMDITRNEVDWLQARILEYRKQHGLDDPPAP